MKKEFYVYIVCIVFFVTFFLAGTPGQLCAQSRDMSEDQLKTVKERYDYANWAVQTGIVIPGLTISQNTLPQLEGMSKVWEKDICRIENTGGNTYSKIRQWWRATDRHLEITMVVCPTFEAAKEYLVSAYANTQISPLFIKPKGSESGLNIGNICYATPLKRVSGYSDVDFIRYNVLIMMRAEDDSRNDLGSAAGILDDLLLEKTREESYSELNDIPTITRFSCEKTTIKQGKTVLLDLDIDNSSRGELRYFWEVSGGGTKKDRAGNFVYYAGDVGRQTITVTVINNLGLHDSKSLEIEVVN